METQGKRHIITIGGMLGSGKSSTAKYIAKELGYAHYSAGDVMRQLAKEQGIEDIRAFNIAMESTYDFDRQVDERTKRIGLTEDNVVFDGHLSAYCLPQSFRVFLDLSEDAAAKRILSSMTEERKASEHIPETVDGYAAMLRERKATNVRRYASLYGVNPYDPVEYDFAVDTSKYSLEEVAALIMNAYREWLA